MKNYRYFLNESKNDILPIQILMVGTNGLTSKSENFTDETMNYLYDNFIRLCLINKYGKYNRKDSVSKNKKNELDYSLPIMNMTPNDTPLLTKEQTDIYNKTKDYSISCDKVVFTKAFSNCENIPKTVFSIDEIEDLQLPIIAKPAAGLSAQGIEKFDSYEDAKKSKLEFDLWSEAKDLDREFRAIIMNNEIICVLERVTNQENDKSVGKKDANEKIDLVYIDQDMTKFPYMNEIKKLQKELQGKLKLDLFSIDLMLDKDKKMWIPEVNGAPGIGPSIFYPFYKAYYKMAYNKNVPDNIDKELKDISNNHISNMKKEYPKEYETSLNPI